MTHGPEQRCNVKGCDRTVDGHGHRIPGGEVIEQQPDLREIVERLIRIELKLDWLKTQ